MTADLVVYDLLFITLPEYIPNSRLKVSLNECV